jgi:hypothetical protein
VNVWKVILVTLVIFSSGVITGSLATRKTATPATELPSRHSSTNRPGLGRPDRMLRMDFITRAQEELSLTPQQMEELEGIVHDGQTRTRALWEEFSPRMRAEFNATQEQIREVLTPEQREQFEEIIKKRQASRRGDRERREAEAGGKDGESAAPAGVQ